MGIKGQKITLGLGKFGKSNGNVVNLPGIQTIHSLCKDEIEMYRT